MGHRAQHEPDQPLASCSGENEPCPSRAQYDAALILF